MEGFWINRKRLGIFLGVSVTLLVIVVVISLNTFLHQPQAQDASRNLGKNTPGINIWDRAIMIHGMATFSIF